MTLAKQFAAYSEWRSQLSASLEDYRCWLAENEISDAQIDLRINQLQDKLREDRLNVAFVAEFSRGKSELINAIFFADYKNRMLPSAAGRTTMCPTELLYDADKAPCIQLLPIQTRETNVSIGEYKRFLNEWKVIELDTTSPEAMQEALRSISEIERVSPEIANKLGFGQEDDAANARRDENGLVEIPRWRHAIINFPHPLLQQGLVILDTPGLNAIGTEPELTLSLLPNAHAVLFILAADTGVTQSDMTTWREHVGTPGGRKKGRIVVLNKIDSLWDELRSSKEINAELARQVKDCARTLDLPTRQVFPVSAQKALVAKINNDQALLERSRIADLEQALSGELIPAKQEIIFDDTSNEFKDIHQRMSSLLESRLSSLREQLGELTELRGKNKGVVEYMMGKANIEKEEFEAALKRYHAVRSVFTQLSNRLFGHLGLDALSKLTKRTREKMDEASFSKSLSGAMRKFFEVARENLTKSDAEIAEILVMMESVYKKFSVEHGLKLGTPTSFALSRYLKEINRLDQWCDAHLNTPVLLLTHDKRRVTQKFFDEVAVQIRRAFERANRDTESWLKAVMAPMETQVREHQIQLRRRLESIKRIHQATETLEERINELLQMESHLESQVQGISAVGQRVQQLLQEQLH
ncbi:MAG: dynamin family protein [Propionivibrio sp.]|nr:dynamin family protein [Propionivibrio sp.]